MRYTLFKQLLRKFAIFTFLNKINEKDIKSRMHVFPLADITYFYLTLILSVISIFAAILQNVASANMELSP